MGGKDRGGEWGIYQIECFMLPASHPRGPKENEPKILVTPTFLLLARFNLFSLDQIKTDDATSHNYSGIHKYVHTHAHTQRERGKCHTYIIFHCTMFVFTFRRYISWFVWHIAQSARSHVDATAAGTVSAVTVCTVGV